MSKNVNLKKLQQEKAFHLPDDQREELARGLFHLVADNFLAAVKGYNFHWNVVSPLFEDLHEMFGADYDQLLEDADLIAERIRALGFSTPGSFGQFMRTASIQEQGGVPDWRAMVEEWINDLQHIAREAREVQKLANSFGDNNTLAMLDAIILHHDKRSWMYRSIIGAAPDRHPQ